jgi:Cu(I)/Ag(I) efflux system membrane fusion protein
MGSGWFASGRVAVTLAKQRCGAIVACALVALACAKEAGHSEHGNGSTAVAESAGVHEQGSTKGHVHGSAPASSRPTKTRAPHGYAPLVLNEDQAASAGLRTESVVERPFERDLRTTGVVALDETHTSHVHTKVRGWIESVTVDFVGKQVRAGAPLANLYSQEVFAAELEYLSILEQRSSITSPTGAFADVERDARAQVLAAAKRRLSLWDVPESEIARLERTREPRRTFTLQAPRSGVVVAKQALAGMFVDPSAELYVISDTKRLWVLADVYEQDVPSVKVGDSAKLWVEGLGQEELEAKVAFIPPTVDEATRTLRVRFDLPNPTGRIRPGAFVKVEMKLDLAPALAVPETAVLHAGTQDIVFVVHGLHIEPRVVVVGPLVGDFYPVREGLSAGERVAVGAQFLIDSESRLRATSAPAGSHAGH